MLALALAALLFQISTSAPAWSATIDPPTAGSAGVHWTITAAAPYCGGFRLGDGFFITPELPLVLPDTVPADGVLFNGEAADVLQQDGTLRVTPSATLMQSMLCRPGDQSFTVELLPSLGLTNPDPGDYFMDVSIGSGSVPVQLPVTIAPANQPPADAGAALLTGTVVIGPVCPVVRVDDPGACADRPYAATLLLQNLDNQTAPVVVQTDSQGSFSVQLDPGSYDVVPQSPPGQVLPRGVPTSVTLVAGDSQAITVHYDSGIR